MKIETQSPFLTITEAAKILQRSEQDVLDFAAFHSLGAGALISGVNATRYECRTDNGQTFCYAADPQTSPAKGFFRLKADDLQQIRSVGNVTPRVLFPHDSHPGQSLDECGYFLIDSWDGIPLSIGINQLWVFRPELARWQATQPKGSPRGRRAGSGADWQAIQRELDTFAHKMRLQGQTTAKPEVISAYLKSTPRELTYGSVNRRTKKTW
ncbi:hypothetical protein [Halothiobacillus sp.]|uniref:hypothetical protein n=1 Tax=Halothiobacillus sp. TaxID=1891311 RepID=UPI00262CC48A|nr:hypothetical protein [Halothiobacillus sp.]